MPERPGLGVQVDRAAIRRYTVDYSWVDQPLHVYRYSRASGEVTYFSCSKETLHSEYPRNALPICEAGSSLVPVGDDRTRRFSDLYREVNREGTLRRMERGRRTRRK